MFAAVLTGCQIAPINASGATGQNRSQSRAADNRSNGFQPLSWSAVLPAADSQNLLRTLASLPRASVSVTGQISLRGVDYHIRLPKSSVLQYTETQKGILWTYAPQEPLIEYTPFPAQKGEQGVLSLNSGALVLADTVPGAQVTLYAGGGYALFSQEISSAKGSPVVRLDAATTSGDKLRLYEGAVSHSAQLMVAPARYGALVALADYSGPLARLGVALWANLRTQTEQPLAGLTWPLRVTQRPDGAVLARSGALDTQIAPDGQITRRWRTASGDGRIAPFSRSAFRYAVVPASGFQSGGQAVLHFALQSKTRYTLSLGTNGGGLAGVLTGRWGAQPAAAETGKSGSSFGPARTSRGVGPSSRRPPTLPAFFGRLRVLHEFYLQSKEGLWIQWLQSIPEKGGAAAPVWYARFSSGGWLYTVGPFGSPANRSQVSRLTSLLRYAKAQAPAAPAREGNAYILLAAGGQGAYAASRLEFPVRRQLTVTLQAPGLNAFRLSAFLVTESTPRG